MSASLAGRTIEAVTFDFWNTIAHEGPSGLFAPRVARWAEVLRARGHHADDEVLHALHEQALASYQGQWRANAQYTTVDATAEIVAGLGFDPSDDLRAELVHAFHEAGCASEIVLAPGIEACLRRLREAGMHLAVVCDVGLTPASALREFLARHSLAALFDALVFSEDVGWYKPAPEPFSAALGGIDPTRAAHVGDRRATDVAGAQAAGMVGVRYRGVYDDAGDGPGGDLVIDHHDELVAALGL